ncbi:hypothetical protein NDI37_07400 [Funiculus sociatus GB2-A5]|uniref:Uncharacterized protein n=1 Tax=Funiculus sociatus GB2-A5 TaxID=2933946 RepID=A0ABV0JNN3_9CYAN|nr:MULTISPECIES: hypothetical protein [unclassified Trichocoleus]MBD1908329.1 hypothetical protein [Trichocoleus sp. FACHB-832]MBD2065572.1 hypothetical protein [Trichocoleus sp. FACHB-6]
MSNLFKAETQTIINEIFWIPSLSWVASCKHPDQLEWWRGIDDRFKKLHSVLKANCFKEPFFLSNLEKSERNFYIAWVEYYKALYDVLENGWDIIAQSARKFGLNFTLQSPGEAMFYIIQCHAAAMFAVCKQDFGYSSWSSKSAYDEYRLRKKEEKKKKGKLYKSNQNKLKNLVKLNENRGKQINTLSTLEQFCISSCLAASKKDLSMKDKIRELNDCAKTFQEKLQAILRNTQGFAWEKGNKKNSNSEGGVYK